MDLVNVKITGTVITARYGTLSAGDSLRTDADFARHLVEECNAATYVTKAKQAEQEQPEAAPEAPAETKPRKSKG
jgi:hypothetical protein